MNIQEDFARFLDANGLSQASVSRSIGVSGSALSQWCAGRYRGDCSTLERKLGDFMSNYNPRISGDDRPIVATANIRLSHFILGELIVSRKMGAIYGAAGCGKTTMIREFVRTRPEAIVIEAVPGMQMATALGEIAEKIGVQSQKNMTHIVRDISKSSLLERQC